jgi:AcrR family transcriptional regulator
MWWRSRERLLDAVLRHAAADPAFARQVIDAVGSLARDNRELKERLSRAMTRSRRGPIGDPYWRKVMLVADYDVQRSSRGLTFDQALEDLAPRWHVEVDSMRKKLSIALKEVKPEHRLGDLKK